MGFHGSLTPNQGLDLGVETVAHKFKFPIRGDETDGSIGLEATESYALMETDIFHLDGLVPPDGSTRVLKHNFIIESQTQFGHTGKLNLHLDGTKNLGSKDISIGIDLDRGGRRRGEEGGLVSFGTPDQDE